jgi:glutamate--cysteine ligase
LLVNPHILVGIEQKLLPPLNAGWYMRKKSNFFAQFDKVAIEFAELIGIDPWKINPYFDSCNGLDFSNRTGIDELAVKVDNMIAKIKLKYDEYKIDEEPYVIVKADNGTYGMGIMVVKSGQEILDINRKHRNKMAVIKDGAHVSDVIIQEGVHTVEELDGAIAEPVVYMMDSFVVGGFYRVHPDKGKADNLNSVGMKFVPLSFSSPCIANLEAEPDCPPNRFYTYGVIARLSMLAASYELEVYK